jgi:MerR family transcriptional regulator, light-induced transcriptional regulator
MAAAGEDTPASSAPLLRIGELSRRTGVGVDTLRAWERRYGVFEPARSEGGFRLYSAADEERARAMRGFIDRGLSAAQAATAVREGQTAQTPGRDGAGIPEAAARQLLEAIDGLDEEKANRVIDEVFATFSFDTVAQEVLLPTLREIGEGWSRGELGVGQEHFATNLLRGRLLGFGRDWMTGIGPIAVLACPEGERHDLGLLVFGLALHERGWRIAYLGVETPLESLADTADALDAQLVVLAALSPEPLEAARDVLRALGTRLTVAIGGGGASVDAVREIGALHLRRGPVEEAARIARELAAGGA